VQLRKKAVRSAIAGATGSEAEQHEYLLKELMPLIEERLAGGAPKKRITAYLDTPKKRITENPDTQSMAEQNPDCPDKGRC